MSLSKALESSENSIKASITAFHPLVAPSNPDLVLPDLPEGLSVSFTTLLQQLRQTITSVSLSFKPPISTDAAAAQLRNLEEQYGQLASCVVLASGGQVGVKDSYIVREWKDGLLDIGTQLLSLLAVLGDAEQKGSGGSSSKSENPYLARTGMVWDAIDRVHTDCSTSEADAVRGVWRGQSGMMKDAWEEFKELLDDEDGDDEGMDDFVDDCEEIFGSDAHGSLSPAERARAVRLKPILSLYFLLHSSLSRFLPDLVLESDRPYTAFVVAGDRLVSMFDDAVSALSPPQDSTGIETSLESLEDAANDLIQLVKTRLEDSKSDSAACLIFLGKWEDKTRQERKSIQDQSLSLSSLSDALDA